MEKLSSFAQTQHLLIYYHSLWAFKEDKFDNVVLGKDRSCILKSLAVQL